MPISRELQARIDALPDEDLKKRIIDTLAISRERRPGDEEAFEFCVRVHMLLTAQEAQRSANPYQWRDHVSPELQAKIDALPDPALRARILKSLDSPREHRASDEDIFEVIVTGYQMATEQQARLRKWQESEVIEFIEYFKAQAPDLYAKYLQHEKELYEKELRGEDEVLFDMDLWWAMEGVAHKWMPGLESMDSGELVGGVLDYARAHLI
jgi:hypothetical protein